MQKLLLTVLLFIVFAEALKAETFRLIDQKIPGIDLSVPDEDDYRGLLELFPELSDKCNQKGEGCHCKQLQDFLDCALVAKKNYDKPLFKESLTCKGFLSEFREIADYGKYWGINFHLTSLYRNEPHMVRKVFKLQKDFIHVIHSIAGLKFEE